MLNIKNSYLTINQNQPWTLHVPQSFIETIPQKSLFVRIGTDPKPQRVFVSAKKPGANQLYSRVKLTENDHSLRVGPLLGILTVRRGQGFKGNKTNFIDIMQTAKKLGAIVYVFTVEDIDWENRTTGAFLYRENKGEWTFIPRFPLPDVVYNRIPYREDEQSELAQAALQKLQNIPQLSLFNKHFFDKWSICQTLGKQSHISQYIPETVQLKQRKDLEHMLEKYSLLYLKPISGKAGHGIMCVSSSHSRYTVKVSPEDHLITRNFTDRKSLWKFIQANRSGEYVIQQGIPLLTYENRPFDIRVLVQKDDTGEWKLSGVGIRVAGVDSITTHVPRGGYIATPEDVLPLVYQKEDYETFLHRLEQTVLDIARALDESYQSLGEMSMDIGLTKEGKIWFFEANAKPMKFDEPHIRKTSLERIIQYSQYLSHFHPKEGENDYAGQANHT